MLFRSSDYGFDGTKLTISDTMTLDVSSGILTVAMRTSTVQDDTEMMTTEVNMSGISGSWLKEMLTNDRFRFVIDKKIKVRYVENGVTKEYDDTEEVTVSGITAFANVGTTSGNKVGSKEYYWLSGYDAASGGTAWSNAFASDCLYYLVLNTDTDEVVIYSAAIVAGEDAAKQQDEIGRAHV